MIDSRSVRTTEAGGPRGYDAGKKINGRTRHVPVDTPGLPPVLVVHAADLQDRAGLAPVCRRLRRRFPWLRLILADGGCRGDTPPPARPPKRACGSGSSRATPARAASPSRRAAGRWVVERTVAWLGRDRMNRGPQPRFIARDVEATVASAVTMVPLASLQLLVRRLARA